MAEEQTIGRDAGSRSEELALFFLGKKVAEGVTALDSGEGGSKGGRGGEGIYIISA